jgi:hypothetical protein
MPERQYLKLGAQNLTAVTLSDKIKNNAPRYQFDEPYQNDMVNSQIKK